MTLKIRLSNCKRELHSALSRLSEEGAETSPWNLPTAPKFGPGSPAPQEYPPYCRWHRTRPVGSRVGPRKAKWPHPDKAAALAAHLDELVAVCHDFPGPARARQADGHVAANAATPPQQSLYITHDLPSLQHDVVMRGTDGSPRDRCRKHHRGGVSSQRDRS